MRRLDLGTIRPGSAGVQPAVFRVPRNTRRTSQRALREHGVSRRAMVHAGRADRQARTPAPPQTAAEFWKEYDAKKAAGK